MTSTQRGTAHQIDLPQGTLDYRERGTGDAIVFLHGALCNGDLWRGVVPELADGYRCITPDLPKGSHRIPMHPDADLTPPGMVRLITSFLDGLGLERVTVVANDSGGAVAQMLAAVHPERIDRLILTSCDTFGQFPPRYLKAVHPLSFVPGLGPQVARLWRTKPVRSVFYWSIVKHGLEPGILNSYLDPLKDPGVRRDIVKFFRGTAPRHTRRAVRKLATFPQPTLIAWAGDDLWFRRKNGQRLARIIPNCTFTVIPDARTFVPEDQPTELARTIRNFLAANSHSEVS